MHRLGLTESRRFDEDYYFAARYRLGDAVFDKVRDLDAGGVSDPIPSKDGIHVVLMVKNAKPVPLGYEASRKQVSGDYDNAAQMRLLEATMKFLRDRSKILIAPDYAAQYRPGAGKQ
jgi:hypothetical protein